MESLRYAEIEDGACIISLPNETVLSISLCCCLRRIGRRERGKPAHVNEQTHTLQSTACDYRNLGLRGTRYRLTVVPYYVGADVLSFVIDC